ncbi:MAG: ATPase, T2SS/T4P/T4SS family [Candidatus Woesearchaeota archaeon]
MEVQDSKRHTKIHRIEREGSDSVLYIDCSKENLSPSIEDSTHMMSLVIKVMSENSDITKIILSYNRDYEYDYSQTRMIMEVAELYKKLSRQRELFYYAGLGKIPDNERVSGWFMKMKNMIFNLLVSDPIGAYVELKRERRHEAIYAESLMDGEDRDISLKYIHLLDSILADMEKMQLIKKAESFVSGYKVGSRDAYRKIFSAAVKPDFMFTKLMASYPKDGEEIDIYTISDDTEVTVFKMHESVQVLYHIIPPEFRLSEDKYGLLDQARKIISEYKPQRQDFVDPERIRQVFYNISHDLLEELSDFGRISLSSSELDDLAKMLVRYTIGFGLLEVLLQDPHVQDITVNSPEGKSPVFLVHSKHGDCSTNIMLTPTEAQSWASKFRLLSGRPLDEANPILDTELQIPGANARVAIVGPPLNPHGLAYAFRRHRDKPWTLALFMKQRMISPLGAGLLSFLIDGARTFLVAGTRSAGKTSLLGSLITEIMRKYRIITIEDTLELPVMQLVSLGYNIQQFKVSGALSGGTSELSAAQGIRTSLRMGDSGLIIGEVRSTEALALYESMRIGALANVVAGTIHGDSPFGVYDRVVNDLNVPKTSFKATDIIVVANPIRSPDGLHKWRRVTQITEVRKHWEEDPMLENGFMDLMKYNPETDTLEPTVDLINGDSDTIKSIAGNVKEWAGNWDAVWDNIVLRSKVKELLLDYSVKKKDDSLLEASFVVRANDAFHKISDKVLDSKGKLESKEILFRWEEWLKLEIKRRESDA